MSWLSAIILGVVQGVAEFLPISSSGHLSVFQHFFGLTEADGGDVFFDVLLHLGTLLAVFAAYRREIADIISEFLVMFRLKKPAEGKEAHRPTRRLILMLIVATFPLLLVLPIKDRVEALYDNTFFIAFAFVVTGLLLFFSDRMSRGVKNERNMTLTDALLIGLGQAIAVVPGISRSGTTISVGMTHRLDRTFAVRFSFLLSIPAIVGANLLSLFSAVKAGIDVSLMPKYLLGVVVAAVSGYASLRLLKYISKSGSFGGFAYYCWGAGILTLILSLVA